MNKKTKIVIIVGQTASGKTALSVRLAKKYNGEIISADSRQVYRGLDIGTGKITKDEMQDVPHHLLDIRDTDTVYSVADFVSDSRKAIESILLRKRLPIIVGGTFFYIEALLGNIILPDVPENPDLRTRLTQLNNTELTMLLNELDPEYTKIIDRSNSRRLIRAIEIAHAIGTIPKNKNISIYDACVIGIKIEKELLHANIHKRLYSRISMGMIEEVRRLHDDGLSYEQMTNLGLEYRCIAQYLQGKSTKEEMLNEIEIKTRQYAKRQMTWLKRDKNINWIESEKYEQISNILDTFLLK